MNVYQVLLTVEQLAGIQLIKGAHDAESDQLQVVYWVGDYSGAGSSVGIASGDDCYPQIVNVFSLPLSAAPLLALQLPATEMLAATIAQFATRRPMIAIVDHFYHAELLSRAAVHLNVQLQVLLAIDVGVRHIGVRPGYDAQRLALATDQLSGLSIQGVIADFSGVPGLDQMQQAEETIKPAEEPGHPAFEAISSLRHTRRLLRQSGIVCRMCVAIDVSSDPLVRHQLFPVDFVTDLVVISPSTAKAEACTAAISDQGRGLWHTRVIARPSLSSAVLHGGWLLWGHGRFNDQAASVGSPPGATIQEIRAGTTLLNLSGESLDLKIGDQVILQEKHPFDCGMRMR